MTRCRRHEASVSQCQPRSSSGTSPLPQVHAPDGTILGLLYLLHGPWWNPRFRSSGLRGDATWSCSGGPFGWRCGEALQASALVGESKQLKILLSFKAHLPLTPDFQVSCGLVFGAQLRQSIALSTTAWRLAFTSLGF